MTNGRRTSVNGLNPLPPRASSEPAVTHASNDRREGSANGLTSPLTSALSIPKDHTPHPHHTPLRIRGGYTPNPNPPIGQITIGALNIRGANSHTTRYKWNAIVNKMRNEKIAVLCLSETHADETLAASLPHKHPQFFFAHSYDRDHSRANGVSIIVNKNIIKTDPQNVTSLIHGRALSLTIGWPANSQVNILAVYAPNTSTSGSENEEFWRKILDKNQGRSVDLLLGDLNIVDEEEDRFPPRPDPWPAVAALHDLCNSLNLSDGWRQANPLPEKQYTFGHNTGQHMSRIDRIYASENIIRRACKWEILPAGIPTADHKLVSVEIHDAAAPNIGKGRWSIPTYLTEDKNFLKEVEKIGRDAKTLMEQPQLFDGLSPQATFQAFIQTITRYARSVDKAKSGKIKSAIRRLEKRRENAEKRICVNNPELMNRKLAQIKAITERIHEIETLKLAKSKNTARANKRLMAESVNKYWCNWGNPKKPRDTIELMKMNDGPTATFTTNSSTMAEIAANHYNAVQDRDLNVPLETREEHINNILNKIVSLPQTDTTSLSSPITYEDIHTALKQSPLGKSPGLNGIPTELYKKLDRRWRSSSNSESNLDIIKMLQITANDIEVNGVTAPQLLEGWICPLYKKKDRREIVNYRPITVLNTEYKIITTAIMNKLATVAPRLVNKCQAAFIKGRNIHDQIDLVNRMIDLCEIVGQDGAIIALDQEKAYDRIRHDYLWRTLRKMGIPDTLVNTIKALYTNAQSVAIINGEISKPFEIRRGVRQGDPLSCLLFNMAIEPLSAALRHSESLKGLEITTPSLTQRIILSLFADDAAVFISKDDKMSDLTRVLDHWCTASGAKFNKEKSIIIPVGSQEYRQNVNETRKLNPNCNEIIEEGTEILLDGASTRYLGAQVGNKRENHDPWPLIVANIEHRLQMWERAYPTIEGRKHIIQMTIGGMTQFHTVAQGMPSHVEDHLAKLTRRFAWGSDAPPPIAMSLMNNPIEQGGRNLLNIKLRNEAIYIMKLKRIITQGPNRPPAADAAEAIIQASLPKTIRTQESKNATITDIMIQNIPGRPRLAGRLLPPEIRKTLNTGVKYNLSLDAPQYPPFIKLNMPAWHHPGSNPLPPRLTRSHSAKCLRNNHGCWKIGDLVTQAIHRELPTHTTNRKNCPCINCTPLRARGCQFPDTCFETAEKVLNHISPKFDPFDNDVLPNTPTPPDILSTRTHALGDPTKTKIFDHPQETNPDTRDIIRIFHPHPRTISHPPNICKPGLPDDTIAFTDGACLNNGETCARAGFGVWFGHNHRHNSSLPVPPHLPQTNNTAEMLAIRHAALITPLNHRLHVKTDSQWCVNTLCNDIPSLENSDYVHAPNPEPIRETVNALRARPYITSIEWIKGHNGNVGNESADTLARQGVNAPNAPVIPPQAPDLSPHGAKLISLNQATALKLILRSKPAPNTRHQTLNNISAIQQTLKDFNGTSPTESKIWNATLRKKLDTPPNIRNFVWKLIHGGLKLGEYWNRIPGYEDRGRCQNCNTLENINHILFVCPLNHGQSLWTLAKSVLRKKNINIPDQLTPHHIMAAPLLTSKNRRGKTRKGASRLTTIVLLECAWQIWKLRCKRLLGDDQENNTTTRQEASNTLRSALNNRLQEDKTLANPKKYGKRAYPKSLILSTWSGTLQNEEALPDNWLTCSEVLVGIPDPPRPARVPH